MKMTNRVEDRMDLDKAGEAIHAKIPGDKILGGARNPCQSEGEEAAVAAAVVEAAVGEAGMDEEAEVPLRRASKLFTLLKGPKNITLKLVDPKSPLHRQLRNCLTEVSASFVVVTKVPLSTQPRHLLHRYLPCKPPPNRTMSRQTLLL